MLYIGIDLGTSACKFLLTNEKGEILNIVSEDYQGPGYGGAMLAAVACGEYPDVKTCAKALTSVREVTHPEPELVKAYDVKYQVWKKLYPVLKGIL